MACLTKSIYFQQTAVFSQRRGPFNRARVIVQAKQDQDVKASTPPCSTRRSIAGSAIAMLGLLSARQASAGFSPTKSEAKEQKSKERAAKMKEKVAKAKQSGGYIQ